MKTDLTAKVDELVHDPASMRRLWQALWLFGRRDGHEDAMKPCKGGKGKGGKKR